MMRRTAQVPEQKAGRGKRKQLPLWQETILLLGVALVLAIVIKTFFVQAFYIPSESMEPGLILNDRILIQKVSYWGDDEPERGDVVVFKDPGGWLRRRTRPAPPSPSPRDGKIGLYPTGGHLVKRVIGVAGDTIVCCDDRAGSSSTVSRSTSPTTSSAVARTATARCRPTAPSTRWTVARSRTATSSSWATTVRDPPTAPRRCASPTRPVRPGRRVRPGRPGRRQGLRAAVARRPLPLRPPVRPRSRRAGPGS